MVWGRARTRQPGRTIRDVEVLVHIGTRSTAGIGTLTVGFALGLLVTYGLADAGWRAVPAHPSDFETSYPRSPDLQQPLRPQMPISPGMRLASLEIPVASDFGVQDTERPAFAERRASFGDRFLLDEHLDSFDERFGGVSTGTETEGLADTALRPSSDLSEIAQSATRRSAPKPAASSPPANAAKKRIRTADLSPDVNSPPPADSHTAIYDIAAHTVYMPNGRRLEAHSGLAGFMDDVRYVNAKGQGPTPPNVYDLTLREELFHGIRAIRLNPVDDGKMFGRAGMLAHTYMLGPNGQSNGCVSFSDYPAFLNAFLSGEVTRLVVVEHLANSPDPETAWGWLPESIKNLFTRS
jgi:hypothetical protein